MYNYYTITYSIERGEIAFILRNAHGRMIECVAVVKTLGMDGIQSWEW